MTLASGTKLGSYEILAEIGKGGMGEVYRARDAKLGRDVAIKVLPASFARDQERMARFEREAKVLALLNHPNIAAIYGFEDSGGVHALVMELVEGPTLAERIGGAAASGTKSQDANLKVVATQASQARPIPVDEALRIARQIADALEYAHERGIVHRDLKPANIKISLEDSVKILDFGLAKAIEGDASSMDMSNSPTLTRMATMQGVLLGTAAYMSPEQAKAKSVDRRADIWAFGCVLYEMLTGKMAFSGETVSDTLASVIKEEPDWKLLPAATPATVRVLLQRCLQKDPKQRLRDIGEARIALDEVLAGAPEPSAPITAPFWRRALPWAVAALTLIALAPPLAFLYFREHPTELVRFDIPVAQKMTQVGGFALSPDGRQLAFVATGADGVARIWIRSMDSLAARSLSGPEPRTSYPWVFWSPDGRRLAFSAIGKLETVDLSSGTVQTLCDAPEIITGGSWNRDGTLIFGLDYGGVMRVSANGGTASAVTVLDSSRTSDMFPSFLPDGRHFIYLRVSAKPGNSGIYVGSIDVAPGKQDSKRLLATDYDAEYVPSSNANIGQLLFLTSESTLMSEPFDAHRSKLSGEPVPVAQQVGNEAGVYGLFSASANGTLAYRTGGGGVTQLTWYDRQGKVLGAVGEPDSYNDLALSPDRSKAVVVRSDSQGKSSALWLFDFSRNTSTRFTFGSASVSQPIWSPDGKRVIFASNPSGRYDLYQKAANGATGEELLLKSTGDKLPTDMSRDGRFLLYQGPDLEKKDDVWVLPLQGGKKPFPLMRTQFNEVDGHFSPDGRWVAYVSDESGNSEIYVRPFSSDSRAAEASGGGGKWQVSYSGGGEPRWSADGKELYYLTLDWKVMEVDVTTGPSFQAGTPKLLFPAPHQSANFTGYYTIDGKRFLFLAPAQQSGQAPFTVVLNWQDMLKESQ